MPGGVYLIQGDGQLVEMAEQAYDSENLLQGLLAEYPNLLAGDQIDGDEPRRWLLISREVPLASEEDGSGRWSVDHLFLDQDAIPTIVEVKRSTDTRIRREVVGQMFDYAANAVVYWPIEDLQRRFEAGCEGRDVDAEAVIEEFLGVDAGQEEFWQKAKTNLQAGKVRLVFVADEIPSELRRVVEFLNQQMNPAEVLAVEIKQYAGQGMKTLVPRVVGQTAEAQRKKGGPVREARQWDEPFFFRALEERRGKDEAEAAEKILAWAKTRELRLWWGRGRQAGSFFPLVDHHEVTHWVVSVWTYGRVEIQFQQMDKPPFGEEAKREELLRRLNMIQGINIPADKITKRPSIQLSLMKDDVIMKQFLETLDWVVEEIRAS
jgi:hypothetical protein